MGIEKGAPQNDEGDLGAFCLGTDGYSFGTPMSVPSCQRALVACLISLIFWLICIVVLPQGATIELWGAADISYYPYIFLPGLLRLIPEGTIGSTTSDQECFEAFFIAALSISERYSDSRASWTSQKS